MPMACSSAALVLAAMSAAGRYPDSTRRRSNGSDRRTAANTTNPVMRVIALSPAVIRVRSWLSTATAASMARSLNVVWPCVIVAPTSKYQIGMKATSRIQASRFRTCAARGRRIAVLSCRRMVARLRVDPAVLQLADPVEAVMLEDQVADDHDRGPRRPEFAGEVPEGKVGLPVEALVWLVEEQHRRVVHQGQRQAEFLLGAARQ